MRDVADLWHMFKKPVIVEGHTKDIGAGSASFWSDVANGRAPRGVELKVFLFFLVLCIFWYVYNIIH